jgi:putative SOS response-associated peptidase YedK
MCGRFTLQIPPEMLAEIFGLLEIPVYPARYNIAPTQQIPVIRQNGQYHLEFLRWGLVPSWAKDPSIGNKMINARSETVHEKPAFRNAIKYKRCLIPSSGFYEWVQDGDAKRPLYIHLKDEPLMVFAGIWDKWISPEGGIIESCSILTTHSNKLIETIHDRQPVILQPEEFNLWLDRDIVNPEVLAHLFHPYPADRMEMYPVSTQVNSTRNEGPDLIKLTP